MSADEFRAAIYDDIDSVIDRPEQDWCHYRVVADDGHAVFMCDLGDLFVFEDIVLGVAEAFDVYQACVVFDGLGEVLGGVGGGATGTGGGANLTGANLTGANLTGAILDDASLTDTNLSRTTLDRRIIDRAKQQGANTTDIKVSEHYLVKGRHGKGWTKERLAWFWSSDAAQRWIQPLELLIEPGTATAEEIGELLAEISKLYQMMGGSGINFTVIDSREPALSHVH